MSDNEQINGWKEIAAFFGKAPRTMQRWERDLGLPVRRIKTPGGDVVFALRQELEAWREKASRLPDGGPEVMDAGTDVDALDAADESASELESTATGLPSPPSPRRRQVYRALGATAVAALVLAIAGQSMWRSRGGPIAGAAFTLAGVTATDAAGRTIWTFDAGHPLARHNSTRIPRSRALEADPRLVDLDADGRYEVLAVVGRETQGATIPVQTLVCLGTDGAVRWRYTPDLTLTFGGGTHGAPWLLTDLLATGHGRETTLWVSFTHSIWWASALVRLDGSGHATLALVNAGTIYALAELAPSADGHARVLAAGVNNEWESAMVTVVSAGDPPLVSPQSPGGRFALVGGPTTVAHDYALLPRTEFSTGDPSQPYNWVTHILTEDRRIFLQVLESESLGLNVFYACNRETGAIEGVRLADGAGPAHAQLESRRATTHTFADCPLRHRADIRTWAPDGTWRTTTIPASWHRPGHP